MTSFNIQAHAVNNFENVSIRRKAKISRHFCVTTILSTIKAVNIVQYTRAARKSVSFQMWPKEVKKLDIPVLLVLNMLMYSWLKIFRANVLLMLRILTLYYA